ncbi:MAG: SprB repeat-containing protein, partial [Bacteroidetes bacterium]|nr:SprB repeat-containing protein [Bacteroidota bacterium]
MRGQKAMITVLSNTVTAVVDSVVNVLCNGNSTGKAYVSVTNGTAPFSYLWSNGTTLKNLTNVPSGNYTLTVTDSLGCTFMQTITITQNTAIIIANTVQ